MICNDDELLTRHGLFPKEGDAESTKDFECDDECRPQLSKEWIGNGVPPRGTEASHGQQQQQYGHTQNAQ